MLLIEIVMYTFSSKKKQPNYVRIYQSWLPVVARSAYQTSFDGYRPSSSLRTLPMLANEVPIPTNERSDFAGSVSFILPEHGHMTNMVT